MRLTKQANYLFTKRGVFYFSKRVPEDLKVHYRHSRITISLRTKSLRAAQARAATLAAKLDEDWLTLRWRTSSDPLSRFLRDRSISIADPTGAPLLSEAQALYLRMKGQGRSGTFEQAVRRSINYMLQVSGDKPIDAYTRSEVNQFRDALEARGLNRSSIRRVFSTVRAAVNFVARENGLEEPKAFAGVYLGDSGVTFATKRSSIPIEDIRRVQALCRELDDEPRWLIALISDTGMRLSEAAGLVKGDVILDGELPHVVIGTHPWRRLKTIGSERVVPLVGAALWALHRAVSSAQGEFLFPKYCSEVGCNANSASAALNKWLGPRVPEGCVIHSFRHSMRDRLRELECPADVIDRIGGWKTFGVGEGYGSGHSLTILWKWLNLI